MEIDLTSEQLAQKIQDEQGYLVVSCNEPHRVGDRIWITEGSLRPEGDVAVIAEATIAEFQAHCLRYFGVEDGWPLEYHYKVRAE